MYKVIDAEGFPTQEWRQLYRAKVKAAQEQGETIPMRAVLRDHESLATLQRLLARFPARCDYPSALFFREQIALAEEAGEEWVVLHTCRDSQSWVKSISSTFYGQIEARYGPNANKFVDRLISACSQIVLFFGYPFGTLATGEAIAELSEILWLPSFMPDNDYGDWSLTKKANWNRMAQSFDEHTEWVKSVVPKDRLIIYHPREGWEPLCRALNVPVPDRPFPNVNSATEWKDKMSMVHITMWFPVVFVATLLLFVLFNGVLNSIIPFLALYGTCSLAQRWHAYQDAKKTEAWKQEWAKKK
jgi:hypothetical protein